MRWFNWLWRPRVDQSAEFQAMANKHLIVGLGNPGRKYRGTRHNIGFHIVDQLAAAYDLDSSRMQQKSIVGSGIIKEIPVVIAKPQTYMNNSGDSVGPLANFYKIPPENVIVIYDELDLPFGTLRLRKKGGAGGHNGMKSIIQHLGNDFPRLRIGIGRPPGRVPAAAYVLQPFHKSEHEELEIVVQEAVAAIETLLTDGVELAMTRHNKSGE